jgi:archaeosortase A (PGF-CTERM-specific)
MGKNKNVSESQGIAILFLLIPTIMLIVGYFIYPYDPDPDRLVMKLLQIPIFLSLILLGIGFLIKKDGIGNKIKILGWMVFAFYWSTQPATLYISEGGDVFNAVVCIIGVYVLSYIAYHEWLSLKRNENIGCLNWIAGASCIAGLVYYIIERTALQDWMIKVTADQSAWVINAIIGDGVAVGDGIFFNGHYVVTIIFACTAIQAMAIFIGMIGVIPKVDIKRRVYGLLVTLIPIYFLNLFRNAMVVFLVGNNITDFNIAHNYISKTGSLITLIILLFIVIKIIPEIFDEIISLTDLYKRNGPLEKIAKKIIGRKKQNEPS